MSNKLLVSTGLLVLIIILINLVGHEFHLRLDLTEDKEYTLSDASLEILENLEDAVTVKAYFSENLPPHIVQVKTEFLELLIEFDNRSDGNIAYEFINPNADQAVEQKAIQSGIQPVNINVREKDQITQQKAFLGAVLSYHGKQEVIPFLRPGAAMEYALSTAIKKLSVSNKPTVGFVSGHGEPALEELSEVKKSLEILYTVQDVPVSDTTDIPEQVNTLVVLAPQQPYTQNHLQKLDAFLARGGRIFVGLNRVMVDFQKASGTAVNVGLETWLQSKGLVVNDDFVVDANCGAINVQQQTPFGMLSQQVAFPYLPIASNFADHPASKGLESVIFRFASSMSFVGDSTKRYVPLVFTSEKSGALRAPQYLDYQKNWTATDFSSNALVLGAVLEGKLSGEATSRMIVVGDGDFATNGAGEQAQRLQPDNLNLLVNSVDWLSDDTGLIELRTKGASSRPIRQLEDGTKTLLKYLNFLLPILLAIGYGIFRSQRNKMKRFKWMSQNYEEA